MKLSIIDLSPVPLNGNRQEAIKNTITTAQHIEKLGFHRIWLAEHHNTIALAGRAPELMIPLVAQNTDKIRVGSGSVLLNHYSPFKVAEVFSTLCEMFPNRIDMGIGRATTGPVSDFALQRNRASRQFSDDSNEQLAELLGWMENDFPADHPFAKVKAQFDTENQPEFWLLGSSSWSAQAAAYLGLNYTFASFINAENTSQIVDIYKQQFKPSQSSIRSDKPNLMLSLSIYAGENDTLAAYFAAPVQWMMHNLFTKGITNELIVDAQFAASQLNNFTTQFPDFNLPELPKMIIGNSKDVAEKIKKIGTFFDVEEIMIQCISNDMNTKLNSFSLLARELL